MVKCLKIISLFNPCSKHHYALQDFSFLKREEKILVSALTSVVALMSLGLLAVVVFRGLVKKFSAKELFPHQKIMTQKTHDLSKKTFQKKSLIDAIDIYQKAPGIINFNDKVQLPQEPLQQHPLNEEERANNLVPSPKRIVENPSQDGVGKEEILEEIENVEKEQVIHEEQMLENKLIQEMLEKAHLRDVNEINEIVDFYDEKTLLHQAVINNNLEDVKLLLKYGGNPNLSDAYLNLPLHYAASCGFVDIVKLLAPLTHINSKGEKQNTALSLALENDKLDINIVICLLNHGADPNISDSVGKLPLHKAAKFGRNDIVQLLIPKIHNINAQDKRQRTSLYYACKKNHFETTKLLLKNKADSNIGDKRNNLPIHLAAGNNNSELVRLLLTDLKDINVQDPFKRTILHILAHSTNDVELIRTLLEKKADANILDQEKTLPLHKAATWNVEIVRLLLPFTKNTNEQDSDGWTSLHKAVVYQKEEIVDLLLKSNSNANIPNSRGLIPLESAIGFNLKILKLLIPKTQPIEIKVLFKAIDHLNVVRELLDHVDLNVQDENGNSPIHNAVWKKNSDEFFKLLITKVKNIDVLNNHKISPLHLAIQLKEFEKVKILLEHGANVELPDPDETLPLEIAKKTGDEAIIKLILKQTLDKQDELKKTQLHYATSMEDFDCVKNLLQSGADANIPDLGGHIPLHLAVWAGHVEITKLLITKSNINAQTILGVTPLSVAVLANREEIVKILLENGADKKIPSKDGMKVSEIALANKNEKIIQLLLDH